MEKIQQAIERARQQRSSAMASPVPPGVSPPPFDRSTLAPETDLSQAQIMTLDPKHLGLHRVVSASLEDPLSDVFRTLRTQLLLRLEQLAGRSVAIVSARDGEGKTLVATNLALSLARGAEGPVFLIDLDFRRPSIAKTLGLKCQVGLAAYIEGSARLEDVLINIEGTQLYVLPQPEAVVHSSELIGSARARAVVNEFARMPGAYVIVDCPPLLLTDEPLAVQSFIDSCLLVVQQGRTSRDEIQRAAELLDETKYVGSILNHADGGTRDTYYGYR